MIIVLLVIIFTHILTLSRLNFLPFPELFLYPYLTNKGFLPYLQILDQHFPGIMFLPVNLDNLGFHTPADARIWQYGIIITVHLLLFVVARRFLKSYRLALLCNLLFLVWQPFFEGWMLWIDSFLPIFYLSAFYFLMKGEGENKVKNMFFGGLFLGIATLFKQVAIPLTVFLGLYILITRKNLREVYYFALGYLPIPLLMVGYMVAIGVFQDFWYWTVTFNVTTFAQMGRKFVTQTELIRSGIVIGSSTFGLLVFRAKNTVLLLIFIIGSLLAAYARFDFVHLQPALPFAIIGTVYVFDRIKNIALRSILVVGYVLCLAVFLLSFYRGVVGNKVYFFDNETLMLAKKVDAITNDNQKIFIFGASPHLYQMTRTKPSGDVFVFQFPWFIIESESRLLTGLTTDKPRVVVVDRTVTVSDMKITDYMKTTLEYIDQNYEEVDRVGTAEILIIK